MKTYRYHNYFSITKYFFNQSSITSFFFKKKKKNRKIDGTIVLHHFVDNKTCVSGGK